MNAVDLTPTFALRKLAVLFDGGKVGECAALVRRLTAITLESILSQLPVDILHDALPASLPVLEAIYVKVSQSSPGHLPTDMLRTDQLVQRLVALFARHPLHRSGTSPHHSGPPLAHSSEEKTCNLHIPCCRSILRVIMDTEPNFRRTVAQRKRTLDKCLRRMGKHGLVEGSDRKRLVSLHEALRMEMDKQVVHYRAALHTLDHLHLTSTKHGLSPDKPATARSPPTEASHQRLMQVSRADVQERLIKNKTLLNSVEAAAHNLLLQRLMRALRARVESDKLLLFHHTELRKMAAAGSSSLARLTAMEESSPNSESKALAAAQTQQMAMTLSQFSQGYASLLRLAREVAEAQGDLNSADAAQTDEEAGFSDNSSSSEDEGGRRGVEGDYLSVTSTLSIMKKMKVVSMNGMSPATQRATVTAASSGRLRNGWLGPTVQQQQTTRRSGGQWHREAGIIHTTPTMEHGATPQSSRTGHQTQDYTGWNGTHGNPPVPAMNLDPPVTRHAHGTHSASTAMLEQEVLYLRQELSTARDQIRTLQDHEKQLRDRLVGQAHQQFQMGNSQFEDLSLGSQRPAELIRRYGELYLDSRVEALDALDRLPPLKGLDVLKLKILFSVIVLSFKATQQNVGELRGRLRHLLYLPVPSSEVQQGQSPQQSALYNKPGGVQSLLGNEQESTTSAAVQMEHHITGYLCKTADNFEVAEIVFDVCQQIYATLYDYPCLKSCPGLVHYVSQCVRITWGLCVQRAPYSISYDSQTFHEGQHTRFHTSDPNSTNIKSYLWPALVDAQGVCVSRAVVIT